MTKSYKKSIIKKVTGEILYYKNMEEIEKIKSAIDIKIQNNYCLILMHGFYM